MSRGLLSEGASVTWVYPLEESRNTGKHVFRVLRYKTVQLSIVFASGKIFAVVGWLDDFGHLLSSYLFHDLLYPLTVDIYAGFAFIVSGLLALIPLAIAM